MELNAQHVYEAYLSAITPVNVFYIGRKILGAFAARQGITKLLAALRICPVDATILQNALALPFSDYEDAVQHAAAMASGLDAIVTRNTNDYRNATLPIYAPAELVQRLKTV